MKLAAQAEIILRACAKVGIIALIDEATGFEKMRKRRDLQLKLQAFIAEDMQEWARMFPEGFWLELARPRKPVPRYPSMTSTGEMATETHQIGPPPVQAPGFRSRRMSRAFLHYRRPR
jgi:hypothetical protein